MRRYALGILVGLSFAFAVDCGSGTSDGSGTGGSGGQAGATGSGGKGGTGTGGATTGSGGNHATGGAGGVQSTGGTGGTQSTGGAGGNHATGGAGGVQSTGGTGGGGAGTGGHAGAGGGSTGTGGHAGAGGSTGTGGHAGAGGTSATGGAGGQGVDSGVTCAELASEYTAAFPAAEACTPGAANQCQTLVPISLTLCSNACQHYVDDATTLNAIRTQWTNQGCNLSTALVICPAAVLPILCINPGTAGNCVATDGAAPGGVCGSGVPTPI